jgi:hypothetical protein
MYVFNHYCFEFDTEVTYTCGNKSIVLSSYSLDFAAKYLHMYIQCMW